MLEKKKVKFCCPVLSSRNVGTMRNVAKKRAPGFQITRDEGSDEAMPPNAARKNAKQRRMWGLLFPGENKRVKIRFFARRDLVNSHEQAEFTRALLRRRNWVAEKSVSREKGTQKRRGEKREEKRERGYRARIGDWGYTVTAKLIINRAAELD